MKGQLHFSRDPIVIAGTAISVGVGVLFYLRSDSQAALAFIAGLQTTLLVLQVQLLLRSERSASRETRQQRLFAQLEWVEWLPQYTERIALALATVRDQYSSTIAAEKAHAHMETHVRELESLARGQFATERIDLALWSFLARSAQKTVRSIVVQHGGRSWWLSPEGRQYWKINVDMLGRGLKVERVIIYMKWNSELDRVAQEQKDAGVLVYRVKATHIPEHLLRRIGVIDQSCCWETHTNEQGLLVKQSFSVNPQDIGTAIERFEAIRALAGTFTAQTIDEP